MARSVSIHRNAIAIEYLNHGDLDEEFGWDMFVEDLQDNIIPQLFPAMRKCSRWQDREDHIIMESGVAEISVAHYCGITSICLAPLDPDSGLHVAWCKNRADKFHKAFDSCFPDIRMFSQGRASNGEQFFAIAHQPGSCVTSKEGQLW